MARFEFDIEKKNKLFIEAQAKKNGRSARKEASRLINNIIGNWQAQPEVTNETLKIKS